MDPNAIDQIGALIQYVGQALAAVPMPWAAVAVAVVTAVGAGVRLFAQAKAAQKPKETLPPFGAMTDAEKSVQASRDAADKANAAIKVPK